MFPRHNQAIHCVNLILDTEDVKHRHHMGFQYAVTSCPGLLVLGLQTVLRRPK